jgi:hypothetical protein
MTLHRSVTKNDDILCKLRADTFSDVSDDNETNFGQRE